MSRNYERRMKEDVMDTDWKTRVQLAKGGVEFAEVPDPGREEEGYEASFVRYEHGHLIVVDALWNGGTRAQALVYKHPSLLRPCALVLTDMKWTEGVAEAAVGLAEATHTCGDTSVWRLKEDGVTEETDEAMAVLRPPGVAS